MSLHQPGCHCPRPTSQRSPVPDEPHRSKTGTGSSACSPERTRLSSGMLNGPRVARVILMCGRSGRRSFRCLNGSNPPSLTSAPLLAMVISRRTPLASSAETRNQCPLNSSSESKPGISTNRSSVTSQGVRSRPYAPVQESPRLDPVHLGVSLRPHRGQPDQDQFARAPSFCSIGIYIHQIAIFTRYIKAHIPSVRE